MRVLFAGTPASALGPLEELLAAGVDVVGVLTREDAPQGRKKVLTPSPVAARAQELGLPVVKANRWDEAASESVAALAPDAAAVVAYGAILPRQALDALPHGWINLHFSALPAWRGAAPVQRALMAGETELGACVFRIEEGLDTGPVYARLVETVGEADTAGTMLERMGRSGGALLAEVLQGIAAGTAVPQPQQGHPTTAAKLRLEDARVDWTQPAPQVQALVRGVTPEPGAWTTWDGTRVKLAEVHAVQPLGAADLPPGTVHQQGKEVRVRTGDGEVRLGRIQPAGRKMMGAADWARGAGQLDQGNVRFS